MSPAWDKLLAASGGRPDTSPQGLSVRTPGLPQGRSVLGGSREPRPRFRMKCRRRLGGHAAAKAWLCFQTPRGIVPPSTMPARVTSAGAAACPHPQGLGDLRRTTAPTSTYSGTRGRKCFSPPHSFCSPGHTSLCESSLWDQFVHFEKPEGNELNHPKKAQPGLQVRGAVLMLNKKGD